jgi:hypothetical protein
MFDYRRLLLIMALIFQESICLAGSVLIVGAESSATNSLFGPNRLLIVRDRVLNGAQIGGYAFESVDVFDAYIGTPSFSLLSDYQAVVVWSGSNFNDATSLGNHLTDYVLGGGNVILMSFGSSFAPGGRWATSGFDPLENAGYRGANVGSMSHIYEPNHPVFEGVSSINAEYVQSGQVRAGAKLLSAWQDIFQQGAPTPMVIESASFPGKVMNLNFYGAYPYPNTNGDIDRLIANAAFYLASPEPVPEPSTLMIGLMFLCGARKFPLRRGVK